MRKIKDVIAQFAGDRTGNVVIIAGLALPMIVGFCGLGGESAYWYFRQRDLQGAVDVAAYNGALGLRTGASSDSIKTQATTDSKTAGWRSADGSITVRTPPTTGSHQDGRSVEVSLTEVEQRYFTAMFVSKPVTITTRAVASFTDQGNACMLALDKSRSAAMQFWGSSTANFTNCNAYSDSISSSGFQVGGSASATMPCALSAGGFSVDSGLHLSSCASTIANAGQVPDPYAALPAPTIPVSCTNGNNASLSPGKYCNGLNINGTSTMAPGVYVVTGGNLKINANANLSGSGVTIYLTGGATIQMNGNATVTLSAPTTGTYKGVLLYGDRTGTFTSNKINGTASSAMTGAMYFPSQEVDMLGNFSGANGCFRIVADVIHFSGNNSISTDCTGYGMSNVKVNGGVALVE